MSYLGGRRPLAVPQPRLALVLAAVEAVELVAFMSGIHGEVGTRRHTRVAGRGRNWGPCLRGAAAVSYPVSRAHPILPVGESC